MASQEQLRAAQEAIRQGRRREARTLLTETAKEDPQDFRVWLLLAGVASSQRASLAYLERAEQLQPGHPTIARARAWAAAQQRDAVPEPPQKAVIPEPGPPPAAAPARQARPTPSPTRPAPPPAPATADERIARAKAARAAQRRAQRRRTVARAAAGALLLVLLVVAGSWAWSEWSPQRGGEQAASQPAGAPVAAVDEAQAEERPAAADTAVDTVVRVQFPPLSAAAATETPAATPTPLALAVHSKVGSSATAEGATPRPTWTVTPSPTPTATPTPTMAPTFISESTAPLPVIRPASVGPNEKWIDVNLTQQRLVAYEGDVPVFDTLVSSGLWNHPTVTGEFRIWLRFTSQTMDGSRLGYDYYLENVPYVMYFYQDYALHGTFWHNNFGTPMSHGCVNLPTPAAEWIFNWSSMGTLVSVHY